MKIPLSHVRPHVCLTLALSLGLPLSSCAPPPASTPDAADVQGQAGLLEQVEALEARIERVRSVNEIKRLQRIYGYYLDRSDWDNVVNLLTEDATAEYALGGVYVGKDSIRELLYGIGYGEAGLQPGQIREHIQVQPVITLSADGRSAKGRWRVLGLLGQFEEYARWQTGPYENEYRKEDGVWKISKLHAYFIMYTDLEQGWELRAWPNTRPEEDLPPDLPPTVVYDMYPGELTAPLHYDNPVTGKPPAAPSMSLEGAGDLADLQSRVARLEDVHAIERLQNIYGYYFDKWQWDQVADLFAEDGSLEHGQRGVYQGRERVRESLELYGGPGLQPGQVNTNLIYQPVIHVDEDAAQATARFRMFSLRGEYGGDATLGGGVFINDYVKEDGTWKIRRDHLFTTFIADYEQGWSQAPLPVPGPSDELPPDAPPTMQYQAFPTYYMLPFHYANPVTGEPVP